jgi:hypothetical protein
MHYLLGALNKLTKEYVYPKIATKDNKYICPDCSMDLILRKGNIKAHHFAHHKKSECSYYEKPSETQIHKNAKYLLKTIIEKNMNITFTRSCIKNHNETFKIPQFNQDYNVVLEHSFQHNGSIKRADVAILNNNHIVYIFEICYTNKTKEINRPEPWFEIDALELINNVNETSNNEIINIKCIRNKKCDICCKEEIEALNKRKEIELEKMRLEAKIKKEIETIELEKMRLEASNKRKEIELEKMRLEAKIKKEIETIELEKMRLEGSKTCTCGILQNDICKCNIPKYNKIDDSYSFNLKKNKKHSKVEVKERYICNNTNCYKYKCSCII